MNQPTVTVRLAADVSQVEKVLLVLDLFGELPPAERARLLPLFNKLPLTMFEHDIAAPTDGDEVKMIVRPKAEVLAFAEQVRLAHLAMTARDEAAGA